MKKKHLILMCIVFSLTFCFLCTGYAQLADTLNINGSAEAAAQDNVFISDAEPSANNAEVKRFIGTTLSSTVTLNATADASASVHVKLYNNSPYGYTFNGVRYITGDGTYDNDGISFSLSGLKKGDGIQPYKELEFDLIFAYANGAVSNNTLNSILNFEFVPADEYIPEIAVNDALDKFYNILNDPYDFEELSKRIDERGNKISSTYIGNVVGATTEDTVFLNNLFSEDGRNYLTLEINGKTTDVTVIIKREDLDGDGTDEMTIYLTPDQLGGTVYDEINNVYACVFKLNASGMWEQVGELYYGHALQMSYENAQIFNTDSIDTASWRSNQEYYGVPSEATIAKLLAAWKNQ